MLHPWLSEPLIVQTASICSFYAAILHLNEIFDSKLNKLDNDSETTVFCSYFKESVTWSGFLFVSVENYFYVLPKLLANL